MGLISLVMPQIGQPDTTEDVKVQNAFTTIQTVINGNIDSTNLSAGTAQSAVVNQSGQTVKGCAIIATSESTSSLTPVTLTTPDQVSNIVLGTNGLLHIWYQARVSESVHLASALLIYLNSTPVVISNAGQTGLIPATGGPATSTQGLFQTVTTYGGGLSATQANTGSQNVPVDATTGQVLGTTGTNAGTPISYGGPVTVFAAAGTYTVSVRYLVLSGTVTATNRRLYVKAENFA